MAAALSLPAEQVKAWKGRGCVECNQKGHRGRVAIYEFFLLNEAIADLIQPGLRTGELREAARKLGWRSLREMAWLKVQKGLIPISEQERWTRTDRPGGTAGQRLTIDRPEQKRMALRRTPSSVVETLLSPNQALAAAASFFQVRLGALTTSPFLMALAVTRI